MYWPRAVSKWFDQDVTWMEKNKPEDEELRRFRTEAAALLGVSEKKYLWVFCHVGFFIDR